MTPVRFDFRPLARSDFELLGRWLSDPAVHRWWHHEFTPEAVERDFGPAIDGDDPTAMFIIELLDDRSRPGRAVGLIQSYRIGDHPEYVEELSAVMEVPSTAGSIDYLIGEPDCRGRGVGRAAIAAFVDRVWDDHPSVDVLIVPVVAANVASWKALAGAGFATLGEGDLEPDNPIDEPRHVIMGMDRPGRRVQPRPRC